jgi:hypothetical protein
VNSLLSVEIPRAEPTTTIPAGMLGKGAMDGQRPPANQYRRLGAASVQAGSPLGTVSL